MRKFEVVISEILHLDTEVQLIADIPQCKGAESLVLTIQDGVLGLSGTIDLGDRENPRVCDLTLGGFAQMFRLNPSVPWGRVTGAVEDGIFCIRIPKQADRPQRPADGKRW
jgi:hypothetical protein